MAKAALPILLVGGAIVGGLALRSKKADAAPLPSPKPPVPPVVGPGGESPLVEPPPEAAPPGWVPDNIVIDPNLQPGDKTMLGDAWFQKSYPPPNEIMSWEDIPEEPDNKGVLRTVPDYLERLAQLIGQEHKTLGGDWNACINLNKGAVTKLQLGLLFDLHGLKVDGWVGPQTSSALMAYNVNIPPCA